MKYILQISTGGFYHSTTNYNEIEKRIQYCFDRLSVEAILIGWNINSSLYEKICKLVDNRCDVYLWLPVFSETGDVTSLYPSLSYLGNEVNPIPISKGENFVFVCPSTKKNLEKIYDIYRKNFVDCGFSGVFLDKIRYASFANGYENGFGCFCENCRQYYIKQNVDLEKVFQFIKENKIGYLNSFSECRYSFENQPIDNLFKARAALMTASVKELSNMFRSNGLKIGLDTFAPILSWFVGQDILSLSKDADFIKPMIYRISKEPAGIQYEFEHLAKKLDPENPGLYKRKVCKILGMNDPAGDDAYIQQLSMLKNADCNIYPGVEINIKAGCQSNPKYLQHTIELSKNASIEALVLAWDILSAPHEHIDCLQ